MADLQERLGDYPRIVADLHYGRITLFVGAGFSSHFLELPDWNDLVGVLWTDVGRKAAAKNRPKDLYRQMSTLAELHWAARQGEQGRPADGDPDPGVLKLRIRDLLEDHLHHRQIANGDLWQRVLDLRFADWVTTNWDDLLERSMADAVVMRRGQQLQELAGERRRHPGMLNPTPERPFVLKIHGCLTRPSGMVVTREDLEDFRETDLYLRSLLVKRFIEQTIVYLGYSLRDDSVIDVIEGVRAEILRLAPDTPSNQLLLYRASPGRDLDAGEAERFKRLNRLGVAVEPYSGYDEFFTAAEAVRVQPPPSLRAIDLAASLLNMARKAGESRTRDRRVWRRTGREEHREPRLRDSAEWFLADVLPFYSDATLDDWAGAFEQIVATSTDSRRMTRFMGPPRDKAHYRVAIERLTREIAAHVAAEQEGPAAESPLDRIITALDDSTLARHRVDIVLRDLAWYADKVHDPTVKAVLHKRSVGPGKRRPEDWQRAKQRVAEGIFTDQGGRRYDPSADRDIELL